MDVFAMMVIASVGTSPSGAPSTGLLVHNEFMTLVRCEASKDAMALTVKAGLERKYNYRNVTVKTECTALSIKETVSLYGEIKKALGE